LQQAHLQSLPHEHLPSLQQVHPDAGQEVFAALHPSPAPHAEFVAHPKAGANTSAAIKRRDSIEMV